MDDYWDEDFCNAVIDASLYWTGDDEAMCPALKYLRTLAGYFLWDDNRPTFWELGWRNAA